MDSLLLPNLFIPGAQKSGTSTLHEYLSRHPDIAMSSTKEPHYLTRPDKGIDYYRTLFSDARSATYRGEASTGYMMSAQAVEIISKLIADPRFVFIFRNPVDRAWSHYWWVSGVYGTQPQGFRDSFLADWREVPSDHPWPVNCNYYHGGCYDKWLEMYRRAFGSERIHLALFEELIRSPLETMNEIFRFLKIDVLQELEPERVNRTALLRFPRLLRLYADTGRVGGKVAHYILPRPLALRIAGYYNRGQRGLARGMGGRDAPRIDSATRAWLSGFYRETVASLRAVTGLALSVWEEDFPVDS